MKLENMNTSDILQAAYLNWLNNYLTAERMAEHMMIDVNAAEQLIEAGKAIHDWRVKDRKRWQGRRYA